MRSNLGGKEKREVGDKKMKKSRLSLKEEEEKEERVRGKRKERRK